MYDKQPSMTHKPLSQLRRELAAKLADLNRLLQPAFENQPVLPGVVTLSRHRCGNAGCRCLSKEEAGSFRPRTEAYQRLRQARSNLGKWHKEVLALIDRIEQERRSVEGLSEEDRKRPLR